MQFHVLSFEGPDQYSRVGGLATRVDGLTQTLAALGFETHLWFIGDPALARHERRGLLHLHRWGQALSRDLPGGVYVREDLRVSDYTRSLPAHLLARVLLPHLERGGYAAILAEEWQTVDAVLVLDRLLRSSGLRKRVSLLWNANNVFGFERIDWAALQKAAVITTVSRYMKYRMREWGVEALVIPNGLADEAFFPPEARDVIELRECLRDRTLLAKMARWDPSKGWLGTMAIVAEMKRQGWRPLLVARGGSEPHGEEVLRAAREHGLAVDDRTLGAPGARGLIDALRDVDGVDVVNLLSYVDPEARRVLFRGADVVLANSEHEPFGLVGLEAMAVGGIACTGYTGEDYVVPGHNALVLETADPREFTALFRRMREHPAAAESLRRAGEETARQYTWPSIVERIVLPRVELAQEASAA